MARKKLSLGRFLLPLPNKRIRRRALRLLLPSPALKRLLRLPKVRAPRQSRSTAREARPTGRFVVVDGVRVHYIARGKGRPVVLIHGNGALAEDFAISGLIDRLALHYRVIAIDRPGFGHTARPRTRLWTPAAQAGLVAQVLARLKVQRPVIVGHSWGTIVALSLAAMRSLDLRGLVLLSGYYYPDARADVIVSAPLATVGIGDAIRSLGSSTVNRMVARQFIERSFKPRPVAARFKTGFPLDLAFRPTQMRASAEDAAVMPAAVAGLRHLYPVLNIPLVIMTGEEDHIIPPAAQSCRLHREAPHSTLIVLPGVGHMIHYAARGRIAGAVDSLMR
jgi:pimeloyl-ACP methyl ester carboxylesterase